MIMTVWMGPAARQGFFKTAEEQAKTIRSGLLKHLRKL